MTLIYFNQLHFQRGASPHSAICQLKDPNGKRGPFSYQFQHKFWYSSLIGLTWVICSTGMLWLAWAEGWGQVHQNHRCTVRRDLIPWRKIEVFLPECWMLGRQNQQMCTVERVAVPTTFISQCVGKHYPHIHQTRAALTLYRFILISFPSVVFYSKIFEKLREQMWDPTPLPHPQSTAGDLLLISSVGAPRLVGGSNFA